MTTLIILPTAAMLLVAAAAAAGAGWQRAAARRASEAVGDDLARGLYRRYLCDVEALTSAYLLQAPSDDEWLAAVKKAATRKPTLAPEVLDKPAREARPGFAHELLARLRSAWPPRSRAPGRFLPSRVLLAGLAVLAAGLSAGAACLATLSAPLAPAAAPYTPAGTISVGGPVTSLSYSGRENRALLAIGDGSGAVDLYDAAFGEAFGEALVTLTDPPGSRAVHDFTIAVSLSWDGNQLASSDGNSVNLWSSLSSTPRSLVLTGSPSPVVDSVAFSPKGNQVAAVGADGTAFTWSVPTGKKTSAYRPADAWDGLSLVVDTVTYSPDGKLLAVGDGNSVTLWDVATGRVAAMFPGGSGVAFSPDGKLLAVSDGNSVVLWNLATRTTVATFSDPASGRASSVAFSPNGTTLAATFGNGSTYLWDLATGRLAATFPGDSSIAFSPDGKLLAVGDGNSVTLWNMAAHATAAAYRGPIGDQASWLAFSPDGATLTVGYRSGRIYLWKPFPRLPAP